MDAQQRAEHCPAFDADVFAASDGDGVSLPDGFGEDGGGFLHLLHAFCGVAGEQDDVVFVVEDFELHAGSSVVGVFGVVEGGRRRGRLRCLLRWRAPSCSWHRAKMDCWASRLSRELQVARR